MAMITKGMERAMQSMDLEKVRGVMAPHMCAEGCIFPLLLLLLLFKRPDQWHHGAV